MATKITVSREDIQIAPLSEINTKEHIQSEDKKFKHLVNWFHTFAVIAARERTGKTYVALVKGEVAGFICISSSLLDESIEGMTSSSKFKPQILTIGKLYICPEYRSLGIGKVLTEYATGIASIIDDMTGCIGIFLDANEEAVGFYKKSGFKPLEKTGVPLLPNRTVRMYLRTSDITLPQANKA